MVLLLGRGILLMWHSSFNKQLSFVHDYTKGQPMERDLTGQSARTRLFEVMRLCITMIECLVAWGGLGKLNGRRRSL